VTGFLMRNDCMSYSYSAIIVDGNNTSRKTLSSVIRQNYNMRDIYSSSCAREASAVLKQVETIDWIFFDNELTDKDAFEFIKEVKQLKSAEVAKYILTSSDSNRDTLLKAATAGVHAFILKPFTPKVILEKMQKLVESKAQRKSRRVDLFEAFEATVYFKEAKYRSVLVDISLGGCKVKSPIYNQGGGMIYDKVKIRIPYDKTNISLDAELIRLERDMSGDEEPKILAAYLFKEIKEKHGRTLTDFLTKIKTNK